MLNSYIIYICVCMWHGSVANEMFIELCLVDGWCVL